MWPNYEHLFLMGTPANSPSSFLRIFLQHISNMQSNIVIYYIIKYTVQFYVFFQTQNFLKNSFHQAFLKTDNMCHTNTVNYAWSNVPDAVGFLVIIYNCIVCTDLLSRVPKSNTLLICLWQTLLYNINNAYLSSKLFNCLETYFNTNHAFHEICISYSEIQELHLCKWIAPMCNILIRFSIWWLFPVS